MKAQSFSTQTQHKEGDTGGELGDRRRIQVTWPGVGINKKKSKGTRKGHSYVVSGTQDGRYNAHAPSISFPLLVWPDQFLSQKFWLFLPHSITVQARQYDMWIPDARKIVDLTDKAGWALPLQLSPG